MAEGHEFCPECGAERPRTDSHLQQNGRPEANLAATSARQGPKFVLPQERPGWLRGPGTLSPATVAVLYGLLVLAYDVSFVYVQTPTPLYIAVMATALLWLLSRLRQAGASIIGLLCLAAFGANILAESVAMPLANRSLGYFGATIHFHVPGPISVLADLGTIAVGVALAAYLLPDMRRDLVGPLRQGQAIHLGRAALALGLAGFAIFAVTRMFTGWRGFEIRPTYAESLKEYQDTGSGPSSAQTNYYDDGTVAGRMRADVADECSQQFGEALTVGVRGPLDNDHNWYFSLYSGEAGAGLGLVNEDTGAIQCRHL